MRGVSRLAGRATQALATGWGRRTGVAWSGDPRPKVLIEAWPGFAPDFWRRALDRDFPGWEGLAEVRFARGRFERLALLPDMSAYAGTTLTGDQLARAHRLRWVHLATADVSTLDGLAMPPNLVITTAAGSAADQIAEHVLGLMIALDRRLDLAVEQRRRWRWRQQPILGRLRGLRGRTVGVVGLGAGGRAVARLAAAFGMRVVGLARRRGPSIEGVEVLHGRDGLTALLRAADFVVLCVPLTAETRGMIGRRELLALGRGGFLINVARGAVIDERALAWALRHGVIAGAALDVLTREPPPRRHPLRRCPNLIITPHVAGNIHTIRDEIGGRFARNLRAFVGGGPLEGVHRFA